MDLNLSRHPKEGHLQHLVHIASAFLAAWLLTAASPTFAQAPPTKAPNYAPPVARDLAEYRSKYPTKLTRKGAPPEIWQDPTPLKLPAGVNEVTFDSGDLKLKAWVSAVPNDGRPHPAVVFCHGGFWFGNEDWDVLKPFVDAGFVVMAPRVRGENQNPGSFEYYRGEVDDVVAAGRYLAGIKGIDKSRIFVSGHSAGGDLATLAVMVADSPFAMSAPIGAALDMRALVALTDDRHKQLVVFDPGDPHEVESRCAVLFTASLRRPIVLFHGDKDWGDPIQKQFVMLAHHFKKQASLVVVPGNHGQSLPNAIPKVIELFQQYKAQ
jgi:dipeptidyl aminopeptidase/acylaminoacyl peptidase